MKIRTFIRLVGIAAIGGVAYVHTQRNGEWTVASISDTLRHLKRSLTDMVEGRSEPRRDTLEHAADIAEGATRSSLSDSSRPYGDFSQHKNDPGHH